MVVMAQLAISSCAGTGKGMDKKGGHRCLRLESLEKATPALTTSSRTGKKALSSQARAGGRLESLLRSADRCSHMSRHCGAIHHRMVH